jgi:2-(1,2-epoxy-1,2-dihydrophenyl)acetyl-CoA isomerase
MPDCLVERDGAVMIIRFNRPDRMNSMGGTLVAEFNAALDEGRRDDRVRAFVVTGEGRGFCAGADLVPGGLGSRGSGPSNPRFSALDPLGDAGRTVLNLYHAGKPTIAAVNGAAVGAGFGLACAFDVRIASDQARFGTIFIKRALGPDFGLSWFLPRLVGLEQANSLFYSGRIVGADEALALGLVSKVVPHEQLMPEALALAHELAKQPPAALALTRQALRRSPAATLEDQLAFEWANQKQCLASAEFQEGVKAFIEKREPDFSGF